MNDLEPVEAASSAISLTAGQLTRQVCWLALWPLLENALTFLVGITDLMVSSRMATGATRVAILDAMGLGSYVGWFFNILQGAVGIGVMALVSRAVGARDERLAQRGLGQGLWLGLIAGFGSLLVLQLGIPLLIEQMQLSPAAAIHANDFLRVLAWSGPFSGCLLYTSPSPRDRG